MEMQKKSTYNVEISQNILDNLIQDAEKDGIQKILGGAHVYRDGKLLLLVRAKGEFMEGLVELPSGTIDQGEKLIDGLVREVKEETGLDVLSVNFFIDSFDYKSGSGKKARQFNFLVEVADGDVVINPVEHSNYIFVDAKAELLNSLGISESVRESIHKSLNFLHGEPK